MTPGNVGSRRAMQRAGGPAEGDDLKETNIAVALLTTEAKVDEESQLITMARKSEEKLRVQMNKAKTPSINTSKA